MRRLLCVLIFGSAAFALATRPARALTEFCPARVQLAPYGAAASHAFGPAQVYALYLAAMGPRSVGAQVAFDTDAGWFTADVPSVTLEKTDSSYRSPIFYVQFPKALTVQRSFVVSALSEGDGFGWASQGSVGCLPTNVEPNNGIWDDIFYDPTAFANLPGTLPAASSIVAKPSQPLGSKNCAQPFKDAQVTKVAPPDPTPFSSQQSFAQSGTAALIVAVNADGGFADGWMARSSGNNPIDDSLLDSAKNSTYRAAIAYCQTVPSFYFSLLTF